MSNPKILHRVYFDDMPPYNDPYLHFLDTWKEQLPDYTIMHWNASNLFQPYNQWVKRALDNNAPVFISEYIRWKALSVYGGVYLDADCEVLNGLELHRLVEELYSSTEYHAFLGVEEYGNGFPTAQTVAAKKDSPLVSFMLDLYDNALSSPLWHWREERGLIGPQLLSLYFRENGYTKDKGFFCRLEAPMVQCGVKVYTQDYFSPKFTTTGTTLNISPHTCVYHLFSNSNVEEVDPEAKKHREHPLRFNEYCEYLKKVSQLKPEIIENDSLSSVYCVRNDEGKIDVKKVGSLFLKDPFFVIKRTLVLCRRLCNCL